MSNTDRHARILTISMPREDGARSSGQWQQNDRHMPQTDYASVGKGKVCPFEKYELWVAQ